jgi:2-desacetyl-2-hydroxyethyl bacteriochlorophyllide A dehydrogenase
MRGTYFLGNKFFETRDMSFSPLKPGEALIRVRACGVCGTDVHIYSGEKGSAAIKPPVVLGHEFAGTVETVGEGVVSLKAGDIVAVDPNIYCGQCRFCHTGKKQFCENLQAIGVTRDGGFAQYCVVPEAQCFLLKPDVPVEHGAMAEPLACCLHGIDRVGIRQGNTACVIGGGAIGLIMVQLAKRAGASFVILSEPVEMRRRIGLQVGADYSIDPVNEDLCKRITEITGMDGVDIVIECVGKLTATQSAFGMAKRGAAILLFSVPHPDAVFGLKLMDVFSKELNIFGSFINPDTQQRAVDIINSGKLILDPLITHRFPLEQVEQAIQTQTGNESIKVIVTP